ncbi:hypothetical protein O7627_36960 [Solwaraspora sp. WMMD1047]|uniref:hypothetical protein n=1 Tax=Solwaraspora sp. WMMD1047 TaxID=3016102 RepID=UPI002417D648|nr:hypothetical protein [Solwaraspora sp. WMMD1047]MDG4834862.1 hypothetical protein [Solwaraspora sp. WMMD1047]
MTAALRRRRDTRTAAKYAGTAATAAHRAYQHTIRILDHHPVPGGELANALYRAAGLLTDAAHLLHRRPRFRHLLPDRIVGNTAAVAIVAASWTGHPIIMILAPAVAAGLLAAALVGRRRRPAADTAPVVEPGLAAGIAIVRAHIADARDDVTAVLDHTDSGLPGRDPGRATDLVTVADRLLGIADAHLAVWNRPDPSDRHSKGAS